MKIILQLIPYIIQIVAYFLKRRSQRSAWVSEQLENYENYLKHVRSTTNEQASLYKAINEQLAKIKEKRNEQTTTN